MIRRERSSSTSCASCRRSQGGQAPFPTGRNCSPGTRQPSPRRSAALGKETVPPRAWYVFEGQTSVDAYLCTSRYVVLVEGKRTESGPTTHTSWMEVRHQVLRNIDAAWNGRGIATWSPSSRWRGRIRSEVRARGLATSRRRHGLRRRAFREPAASQRGRPASDGACVPRRRHLAGNLRRVLASARHLDRRGPGRTEDTMSQPAKAAKRRVSRQTPGGNCGR